MKYLLKNLTISSKNGENFNTFGKNHLKKYSKTEDYSKIKYSKIEVLLYLSAVSRSLLISPIGLDSIIFEFFNIFKNVIQELNATTDAKYFGLRNIFY